MIVRGYHFLLNRGGVMKRPGGSQIFFMRNRGSQKKNQEIIGWLQILMKISFNEITPKVHIFCAMCIGGYICFFNIVAVEGGHKIFDHQIGGVTKILPMYFRKFMTPPIPKKMVTSLGVHPNLLVYTCMNIGFKNTS